MNRRQAAQLLGVAEIATALDANRACLAKMRELDERIQTAPSEALRRKYQDMRVELLTALQVMTYAGTSESAPTGDDIADLPRATPVSKVADEGVTASSHLSKGARSAANTLTSGAAAAARSSRYRRWLWITAAAFGSLALSVVVASGVLRNVWEEIRPISEEERLTAFQDASRLEAEIKGLQERLEEASRGAESGVRDAQTVVRQLERDRDSARNESERTSLEERLKTAQQTLYEAQIVALQHERIFGGTRLIDLQAEFRAAQTLVDRRGDDNSRAGEMLRPVRDAYRGLVERLPLLRERAATAAWAESLFIEYKDWAEEVKLTEAEDAQMEELWAKLTEVAREESDEAAIARYNALARESDEFGSQVEARLAAAERERQQGELARQRQATAAAAAELKRWFDSIRGNYYTKDRRPGSGNDCFMAMSDSSKSNALYVVVTRTRDYTNNFRASSAIDYSGQGLFQGELVDENDRRTTYPVQVQMLTGDRAKVTVWSDGKQWSCDLAHGP